MLRRAAGILATVSWLPRAASACHNHVVEAGVWFESIAFESPTLGPPITREELATIASLATSQVATAFDGLAIRLTDRRDAPYRVRVVQELRGGGAGESRAFGRAAGAGEVSFAFLATGALHHSPSGADRGSVIEAIARGIARTAVHEFTHQLLPRAPIHDSRNVRSYEYASAARREQYYGPIEWGLAWPLLSKRLGTLQP
jgi:hypothetical protein